MLQYADYGWGRPDLPYANFIDFLEGLEAKFAGRTALFYRADRQTEFTTWTFERFVGECRRVARGLLAAGLRKGDRVALWAENRPEWMAVWMGAVAAGCVIVPVDFLVSETECRNIIRMTRARAFFYGKAKAAFAAALRSEAASAPDGEASLAAVVETGEGGAFAAFGAEAGDTPLPSADALAEKDPASIVFTSGTTGFAKGVVLSHKGIIANVSAAIDMLRPLNDDVFINVLPLHHTYPTTCSFLAPLASGCATIIVEKLVGSVVINDIRDAGGSFLIAVPILYDKVMAAIDEKYQKLPAPLRASLDVLRKIALAEAKKGRVGFGRAVFRFIRKKAGLGSINILVAGGGALSPRTADFFDSFGFNMVHGYGMSENGPLVSVNTPWHRRNVSVGLPVKYTEVKIAEADETGSGEILVRSPSLMLGYWENEEAAREMFTEDGWLKTGDLGYLDEQGFIYINGRKKNLIVSAGGKNIYPEEIESHFSANRVIAEILVTGRRTGATQAEAIFAVVYPNYEALREDNPGVEIDEGFVKPLVKAEIEKVNRSLVSYKKIADFTLTDTPFEKNAQQKIRRFLYKHYEKG